MKVIFTTAFAAALASTCFATVGYEVKATSGGDSVDVTMTFRAKDGVNALEIPNWAPGAYDLSDGYKNISKLMVTDEGKTAAVLNPKPNQWTFDGHDGDKVKLTYTVSLGKYDDRLHYSGPATYLYLVDRKMESCTLHLSVPDAWQTFTGLEDTDKNSFKAPTYDVLADNPVTSGILKSATYTVRGVPHYIVIARGPADKMDMDGLKRICTYVSRAEGDFWGGFPFKKYVWHVTAFEARDGGWGLEHLASTQVGVSTGLGPRLQSVLLHEYFHAWNVKRIRAKVLGPFDYDVLPKTGALWWLEGVTDYYASLFQARYGSVSEEYFGDQLARNYAGYMTNPAHTKVGPYDASFRVNEANNGRGNSNGYQISYYTLGWLAGFCFDSELRAQSNGKVSLDDVIHDLFKECNGKPGFEEGRIRDLLVKHGGERFGPMYDEWILKAGNLPVEKEAARLGWTLHEADEPDYSFGLDLVPNDDHTGLTVRQAADPASKVLQPGDVITKIGTDGTAGLQGGRVPGLLSSWANNVTLPKENRTVPMVITRAGVSMTVQVPTRVATKKVMHCYDMDMVSPWARLARVDQIYGESPELKG